MMTRERDVEMHVVVNAVVNMSM